MKVMTCAVTPTIHPAMTASAQRHTDRGEETLSSGHGDRNTSLLHHEQLPQRIPLLVPSASVGTPVALRGSKRRRAKTTRRPGDRSARRTGGESDFSPGRDFSQVPFHWFGGCIMGRWPTSTHPSP